MSDGQLVSRRRECKNDAGVRVDASPRRDSVHLDSKNSEASE